MLGMPQVDAFVQIAEPIPEDPRIRHFAFARSENHAIRLKTIHHMSLDPMTLEPISGQPYSANNGPRARRPLDKVDPGIVAMVNMKQVEERARMVAKQHKGAQWAVLLIRYYKDGFPKSEKPPEGDAAPRFDSRPLTGNATGTVEDLKEATILREATTEHRLRTFASVFQVPKNEEVDRAIINCKLINFGFAKPPSLSLAEIGTLLGLVKYFEDATISTADIRHFFWQLRVPKKDMHRFSVRTEDMMYHCAALPMGWSWSPWVAQAIAGLVVAAAAAKMEGDVEAVPASGSSEDSPPPYWYIRDKSGAVRGIVVIWYDNFLVATARKKSASERDWNKEIRAALDQGMKEFKLQWKRDKETKLAWTIADNDAKYIGIHFSRDAEGVFTWKHIDENVDAWKKAGIAPEMPLCEVAQVLGFITWDAHVRLGRRLSLHIRDLMSKVGALYHTLNEAGVGKRVRDVQPFELTAEEFQALSYLFEELLQNKPNKAPDALLTRVRLLASDATPTCAAGVVLDARPRPR